MKVKVMTFNIRLDNAGDGEYRFDNRKEGIKEFLDREKPDLIGFQEVLPHVRAWLSDNLPDYVLIGMGRGKNYNDESASIAYRRDKFDLVRFEQFWLSDTPDVPGSHFHLDQSGCPRICALATLVDRETATVFNFANTHLDHIGRYAKVCGASMIVSKVLSGKEPLPFFITGDMNGRPNDPEILVFKKAPGVNDLTDGIPDDGFTFHNYGKVTGDYKIDYIFSSGKLVEGTLKLHDDKVNGVFLSDHYPVSVVAEI